MAIASTSATTSPLKTEGSSDSWTVGGSSGSDYVTARRTASEQAASSCAEFVSAEVAERIERSKNHWSELMVSDSILMAEEVAADNVEVFKSLQSYLAWGFFFRTFGYDLGVRASSGTLEVGEMFAEGGQAVLFHAHVTWSNPEYNEVDRESGIEYVLKVFKKGTLLRELQSQWPLGYLQWVVELNELFDLGKPLGYRFHCQVHSGVLLEDGRFAFLMTKEKEDLRSLIDRNMREGGHGHGPPFPKEEAEDIMYRIARGMKWLHNRDIVHRDLKASNVLVHEFPNGQHAAVVADFECSIGVVGTGYFRAPEILQACRDRNFSQAELFTRAVDSYSYGMTCYEILTGKLPFQHHPLSDKNALLTDLVIKGLRPEVPEYVDDWARELLGRCWHSDPAARPGFDEILGVLELLGRCWHSDPAARPGFDEILGVLELLGRCWHSDPAARPGFDEILGVLEANSNSQRIKNFRKIPLI